MKDEYDTKALHVPSFARPAFDEDGTASIRANNKANNSDCESHGENHSPDDIDYRPDVIERHGTEQTRQVTN